MPDLKTVLMIAPYFVPRRRVGAVRPFRFAANLHRNGYRPVVMTIGHKPAQMTSAEAANLSNIPVINIETGFDRTTRFERTEAAHPPASGISATDRFSQFIDRHTPLDTWIYLFIRHWRWIQSEALRVKPDLIWATGDPWSGLWLGMKLAEALNIPFVADFRDPWTLTNVGLRKRSLLSGWIDRKVEKKVIESSDFLVFTSDATRWIYSEHYQLNEHRSATIYNTFDSTKSGKETRTSELPAENKGAVQIHFFGRFRRLSPVQPIIEILCKLKEQKPEISAKIRILSYGTPETDQTLTIERAGLSDQFIFKDSVSPEEAQNALKSADLLLLSTHPSRESIIPAKLWDYLVTGKPILSIVPNPEVEKILNGFESGFHFTYGNGRVAEEYLARFVISVLSGERKNLSGPEIQKMENQHNSLNRTEALAAIFDRLTAEKTIR